VLDDAVPSLWRLSVRDDAFRFTDVERSTPRVRNIPTRATPA
jgi:hypothetical protein